MAWPEETQLNYESPLANNPYTAGLPRKPLTAPQPSPLQTYDPTSEFGKMLRAAPSRTGAGIDSVQGLVQDLSGFDAAAQENYLAARAGQNRAQMLGPKIQSLDDAKAAGGGVGDYGMWLGNELVQQAVELPITAAAAGVAALSAPATVAVGAAVGGGALARRMGFNVAKGIARRRADQIITRQGLGQLDDVVVQAQGRSAAEAAARASLIERETAKVAARPAVQALEAAGQQRAQAIGAKVGAAAGEFPSLNLQNVELLDDESTTTADKLAMAGATALAAGVGGIFEASMISRALAPGAKEVVAKNADTILQQLATRGKRAVVDSQVEGGGELAQEAIQRASHAYVLENMDALVGKEAVEAYLASYIGGTAVGGAITGGLEMPGAANDLRKAIAARVRAANDSAPKPKPTIRAGEPMPESSAAETFANNAGGLKFNADVEARADAYLGRLQQSQVRPRSETDAAPRLGADFLKGMTDSERLAYQLVNVDGPLAESSRLRSVVEAMGAHLEGRKLSPAQQAEFDMFAQFQPEEAGLLDFSRAQGGYAALKAKLDTERESVDSGIYASIADLQNEYEDEDANREALRQQLAEGSDVAAGEDFENAVGMTSRGETPLSPIDRLVSAWSTNEPNSRQLQDEARGALLKNAVYSGKSPEWFAEKMKEPGVVALRTAEGAAPAFVDIGSLVNNARTKDQADTPLDQLAVEAISNLMLTGTDFDLSTLKPGAVTIKSDGARFRLTPRQVAGLRNQQAQLDERGEQRANGANERYADTKRSDEMQRLAEGAAFAEGKREGLSDTDAREYAAVELSRIDLVGQRGAEFSALPIEEQRAAARSALDAARAKGGRAYNDDLTRDTIKAAREEQGFSVNEGEPGWDRQQGPQTEALKPPPGQRAETVNGTPAAFVPDQTGIAGVNANVSLNTLGARLEAVKASAARVEALNTAARQAGVRANDIVSITLPEGKTASGDVNQPVVAQAKVVGQDKTIPVRVPVSLLGYDRTPTQGTTLRKLESSKRFDIGREIGEKIIREKYPEGAGGALLERRRDAELAALDGHGPGGAMDYYKRAAAGEFQLDQGSVREQPWDREEAERDPKLKDQASPIKRGEKLRESGIQGTTKVGFGEQGAAVRQMPEGERSTYDRKLAETPRMKRSAKHLVEYARRIFGDRFDVQQPTERQRALLKDVQTRVQLALSIDSTGLVASVVDIRSKDPRRQTLGTTMTLPDGGIIIGLEFARLRGNRKRFGPENSADTIARIYAHEFGHVLDAVYGEYDADKKRFSDFADIWGEGSLVWDEIAAARKTDPLMDAWFGSVMRQDYPSPVNGEVFAQMIALRVQRPEKFNEHFTEGRKELDRALEYARKAADYFREGAQERVQRRTQDAERSDRAHAKAVPKRGNTQKRARPVVASSTQRFNQDINGVAAGQPGEHDLKNESSFVNELLKAFGVERTITVKDAKDAPAFVNNVSGATDSKTTIYLGDQITGGERVEVLTTEAARVLIDAELDALKASDPALHQAIVDAHAAWRAANETANLGTARASRETPARAEGMAARGGQQTDREYTLSFDSWLSTQVSRALGQSDKGKGAIEKFFADVAQKLKALYDRVFAADNRYAPDKSVEAWVKRLGDRTTQSVNAATGQSVPRGTARDGVQAAVAAAVGDTGPKSLKATLRFVRDVLPAAEKQILDRLFSSDGMRARLLNALPDSAKMIDHDAHGTEYRIALGYQLWRQGKLSIGPQSRNVFEKVAAWFQNILGFGANDDYVQRVFTDMAAGRVQTIVGAGKNYSVVKQYRRGAMKAAKDSGATPFELSMRTQLYAAADWFGNAYETVAEPLSKAFVGSVNRMKDWSIPAANEIRALLVRQQGTTGNSDEGMAAEIVHQTARFRQKSIDALADLSARDQRRVLRALQMQVEGEVIGGEKVNAAVKQLRAVMDEMFRYGVKAGVFDPGQRRDNFWSVQLDLTNESSRTELRKMLLDPELEQAIRALPIFADKETQERAQKRASYEARVESRSDLPPDPKAIAFFEKQREHWKEGVAKTNQSIIDALMGYDIGAIEKQLEASKAREAKWAAKDNVSEDLMDAFNEEQGYMRERIRQLREAGLGSAPDFTAPGAPKAERETLPSDAPIEQLVDNLVEGAVSDASALAEPGAPQFRAQNMRLMQFIYDVGKGTPEHEARVRKFASLQVKDPVEALARYIEPMVKHSARVRRFGRDDARLKALLAKMKTQGATDAQIAETTDIVNAMSGTYGAGGSPVLRAISPALADRFSGRKTQAFVQGVQAYQNLRLLPLAVISSIVDPMGIAVRTGGDFKTAWDGFKYGMKALVDKQTKAEIRQMMSQLGALDDTHALSHVQHFAGEKYRSASRTVNDTVFRLNGMSSWVQATRYMALRAAHGFALKHAGQMDDKHSARYLAELRLQPGDIQADPQRPGWVQLKTGNAARDERVRRALMQFVDEAVLRPNTSQAPLWHADPYMGLVTQYKGFAYAIHNQIGGRISRELQNGNPWVYAPALSYVPIVIMSEMLRDVAQGDGEEKEEWGPAEWTQLGMERSGVFFSPQVRAAHDVYSDAREGHFALGSLLGPTGGQAKDFGGAAIGHREFAGELEDAMPASALWKKWNNDPQPETTK